MSRALALVFPFLAACVHHAGGNRWSRHASPEVWASAFEAQLRDPVQIVPEVGLAATTLALLPFDDDIVRSARDETPLTGGSRATSNILLGAVGGTTAAYAAWRWFDGDGGRTAEVFSESILVAGGASELLKRASGRYRPSRKRRSRKSFPSSHTAVAFASATVLARAIDGGGNAWASKLGYLAFVPAALVGVNRVESSRHNPTDVTAGALIGMFAANLLWNAHYGDGEHGLPGIYDPRERVQLRLQSWGDEERAVFGLALRF